MHTFYIIILLNWIYWRQLDQSDQYAQTLRVCCTQNLSELQPFLESYRPLKSVAKDINNIGLKI